VCKHLVQHYDDVVAQQVRLKLTSKARLRAQGVIVRGQQVCRRTGRETALQGGAAPVIRQAIGQFSTL
jgi:hypothetical protein